MPVKAIMKEESPIKPVPQKAVIPS